MTTANFEKPSGWKGKKGDKWWTRDSQFGVRYMCPTCGKNNLGVYFGSDQIKMHFSSCAVRKRLETKNETDPVE